jgi:YrbI family 3-deoxy-D-manno-octulosonate 8-phosphate phosphatase
LDASSTKRGEPLTACVILARGGSKGIPGKNLKTVGGVSLIGRAVRAGRAASGVGQVFVSTDDPAIAAEARRHGARIVDRPTALADDQASSEAGWLHAIPFVRAVQPGVDRLVFLQCTSPFTTGADIDACLAAMTAQGAASALSVIPNHMFLWTRGDDGFGLGQNHDADAPRQRRQDLPPQYAENGAIYCVDLAAFEAVGRRFCGPVALCVVDHPPVEIDSPDDLALCRQIAQTRPGVEIAATRLNAVRALAMDFDGVHTDNLVATDQEGRESVTTYRGDGMGLGMLKSRGDVALMILSKERNPVVLRRAEKLGIEVYNSVDDKVAALERWLSDRGLGWEALLYVGNDVNDQAAMERAGLSACPSDAHSEILGLADWVLPEPGGRGALRALCDRLLAVRE